MKGGGFIRRFANDRSGASAVELALAAPLFLGLILATFDFARGFSAKLDLVAAAARTAELATAPGQVRQDYSYLEAEAETAAGTGAAASVDSWLECSGTRQAASTTVCPVGQAYARYVSVSIVGSYDPVLGFGGYLSGVVPIQGRATVRIQ